MDTLALEWLDSPVDVDKGVQLPSYTLKDVVLHNCSQTYTAGKDNFLLTTFVNVKENHFI